MDRRMPPEMPKDPRTEQHFEDPAQLPIGDYDRLSEAEILGRIEHLSLGELRHLRDYEQAHRRRPAVLGTIDRKLTAA